MKKLILPCLLAAFLGISCGSLKEPEFRSIENAKMSSYSLSEINARIDLGFYNPNKDRLKLKKAEGDIWADNTPMGSFSIDTLLKIEGNSNFVLPVDLKLKVDKAVAGSLGNFLKKEVTLRIEGTARVGKGLIFINYPIRYEGKQKLEDLMK